MQRGSFLTSRHQKIKKSAQNINRGSFPKEFDKWMSRNKEISTEHKKLITFSIISKKQFFMDCSNCMLENLSFPKMVLATAIGGAAGGSFWNWKRQRTIQVLSLWLRRFCWLWKGTLLIWRKVFLSNIEKLVLGIKKRKCNS